MHTDPPIDASETLLDRRPILRKATPLPLLQPLENRILLSATLATIASFDGVNGSEPHVGVAVDNHGDLFGTTELGGANDKGDLWEIPAGTSTISVITSFNSTTNPADNDGFLTVDGSGNVYFGTNGALTSTNTVANFGQIEELALLRIPVVLLSR